MGDLRKRIEDRLRIFVVPKADGGNHEDAYAELKAYCDRIPDALKITPQEIIMTQILNDVKRHLQERRKARRQGR